MHAGCNREPADRMALRNEVSNARFTDWRQTARNRIADVGVDIHTDDDVLIAQQSGHGHNPNATKSKDRYSHFRIKRGDVG